PQSQTEAAPSVPSPHPRSELDSATPRTQPPSPPHPFSLFVFRCSLSSPFIFLRSSSPPPPHVSPPPPPPSAATPHSPPGALRSPGAPPSARPPPAAPALASPREHARRILPANASAICEGDSS